MNNGVYKCGFATTQAGFQAAEAELFAALDELEAVLRWACLRPRLPPLLPYTALEKRRCTSSLQPPVSPSVRSCPASLPRPALHPSGCSRQRFVCGERFTEADLRLFPTIVRFDAVYATLFKCSRRRVADYPHLQAGAAGLPAGSAGV